MPNLEQFVFKITKEHIASVGLIEVISIDPNYLISTRPYLRSANFDITDTRHRRRASPGIPEGILHEGEIFFVDGHHKSRSGCGIDSPIECRILITENLKIHNKLSRRNHGPISGIELR